MARYRLPKNGFLGGFRNKAFVASALLVTEILLRRMLRWAVRYRLPILENLQSLIKILIANK